MDELEKRCVGTLEGLDEAGNALLGSLTGVPEAGNPHYTMSQRWAYARQKGGKGVWKYCLICKVLTFVFKPFYRTVENYDHCTDAIKDFPTDLPAEG